MKGSLNVMVPARLSHLQRHPTYLLSWKKIIIDWVWFLTVHILCRQEPQMPYLVIADGQKYLVQQERKDPPKNFMKWPELWCGCVNYLTYCRQNFSFLLCKCNDIVFRLFTALGMNWTELLELLWNKRWTIWISANNKILRYCEDNAKQYSMLDLQTMGPDIGSEHNPFIMVCITHIHVLHTSKSQKMFEGQEVWWKRHQVLKSSSIFIRHSDSWWFQSSTKFKEPSSEDFDVLVAMFG